MDLHTRRSLIIIIVASTVRACFTSLLALYTSYTSLNVHPNTAVSSTHHHHHPSIADRLLASVESRDAVSCRPPLNDISHELSHSTTAVFGTSLMMQCHCSLLITNAIIY